ncbi:hypothetical protein [Serratia fonticola]|jgi:hypothetical protein
MKKIAIAICLSLAMSPAALAKKPGSGSGGWQNGNAGHQLGCLILSLLNMQGCEKPKQTEKTKTS